MIRITIIIMMLGLCIHTSCVGRTGNEAEGSHPAVYNKAIRLSSCSVSDVAGGARIKCSDGTSAFIADGIDGVDGRSCSVITVQNGIEIRCDDGTTATVTDGTDGTDGTSCSVSGSSNAITISCDDGSACTMTWSSDGGAQVSCGAPVEIDADADSYPSTSDCNDHDSSIHPNALEICGDGVDQDCSGSDRSCNTSILWSDGIDENTAQWGFDWLETAYPIGNTLSVTNNDALGASITRVVDPITGTGSALRLFGQFDAGGSKAQVGIFSFANTAFGNQAKSNDGIYVAQEWLFPQVLSANGDPWSWIDLLDWHSTGIDGADRWHSSPGLILARDGSMHAHFEWGGDAQYINQDSADSLLAFPVGEWFNIEMYYKWSATSADLRMWVNGDLFLEQLNVVTKASSHQNVEMYTKWYGSDQGHTSWSPTPSVRYIRNIRISGSPITH